MSRKTTEVIDVGLDLPRTVVLYVISYDLSFCWGPVYCHLSYG